MALMEAESNVEMGEGMEAVGWGLDLGVLDE